jgi:hypothetical protein
MTKNFKMRKKIRIGEFVKTDSNITGRIEIGKVEKFIVGSKMAIISLPCGNGKGFYIGGLICPVENLKKATKHEIEKYHATMIARKL